MTSLCDYCGHPTTHYDHTACTPEAEVARDTDHGDPGPDLPEQVAGWTVPDTTNEENERMSQPDRAGCVDDHTTYAPMTDPSTWTEQEQGDLVAALKNIAEACSTVAKEMTAAFESLTEAINAVEAAKVEGTAT